MAKLFLGVDSVKNRQNRVGVKCTVGTVSGSASRSRKERNEAVENASNRKKTEAEESKSDSELKEMSKYVDESSDDVVECSASGDSEGSWGSEKNSDDGDNDPLPVPFRSRYISVERYDLRTIMDEVGSFSVKILIRSRMVAYREFKKILVNQDLKKIFKQYYFGHLRNLPQYLIFNRQMVHYLLLRCVKKDKMGHEMWFCVNNKPICFGLKKFCSIMRLKFSSYFSESKLKKVLEKREYFSLRKIAGKSMDKPFSIPRILRWHTTKSDKIIKGDSFKYKGKVTKCDSAISPRHGGLPIPNCLIPVRDRDIGTPHPRTLFTFVNFPLSNMNVLHSAKLPGLIQGGNAIPPCSITMYFPSWQFPETRCDSTASRQG
ncbi:hypothetical protein FXO38_16227 [Capsicum annuum]|nr:hypothetical protein FXO38_16227 [Capsicum annuum]